MADKNNGGDKTEKPTPKRLKDARKKGDVPKSKDITSTTVLSLWLVLFSFLSTYAIGRIAELATLTLSIPSGDFISVLRTIGWGATELLLMVTALFVIPILLFGLIVEFLQAGPVLTFEKVKPQLSHLNPASGLKRMFSMDNLIEVLKSIAKTAILFFLAWLIFKSFLPELVLLPRAPVSAIGESMWAVGFKLFAWTLGIFTVIAILDAVYQRHSFTKKLRMSLRDIKQELKDSEGDPIIKQQRRQAHQEWAQASAAQAARNATALIVNPTHVAIAISYDRDLSPVPMVTAKGEDHMARSMREAAEQAGVPIVRNIELARGLLRDTQEGDAVPAELFDIIAEVILWAQEVRDAIAQQKQRTSERRYAPPGEDLTRYPEGGV